MRCSSLSLSRVFQLALFAGAVCCSLLVIEAQSVRAENPAEDAAHLQGEIAGEATMDSVLLHSRLTFPKIDEHGDVPGRPGAARFEVADDPRFEKSRLTPWLKAVAE